MKARCLNPNDKDYPDYGGRGISVCERWLSFDNFFEDMGHPPPKTELDRLDNDGNYEPSNCAWRSKPEQSRNRRCNVLLTYLGRTQCMQDWANELGIHVTTIASRLKAGRPHHEALSKTPLKPR